MRKEIEAYNMGYRVTQKGQVISHRGTLLKLSVGKGNYLLFYYRSKTRKKMVSLKVHRLQAFQKYGHDLFEEGVVTRHKDGDSQNNYWENILIGSQSENIMDIPEHIRIEKALHATSFCRKYDKDEVINYHNAYGKSYKKTMAHFGITSKGTLHYILNK
jgi:hypothetical protein